VGSPVGEDLPGKALDTSGRRTLSDADGENPRGQQEYVATLEVLAPPAVDLR
jgi:hypothetical protein